MVNNHKEDLRKVKEKQNTFYAGLSEVFRNILFPFLTALILYQFIVPFFNPHPSTGLLSLEGNGMRETLTL